MADTLWTPEQLKAITEGGRNLLVAAAAGSGKTAVLVERIIRKITSEKQPVDIDRLLVVTFTNAAAAEMRERIGSAIAQKLEANPDSKVLQRQLTLLNKASITTIHSFCLEVIRNNFHCIDLDPSFRIADETETVLMKAEVMDELFEDIFNGDFKEEGFFDFFESYGGNRDDSLVKNMVLEVYEFVQSHPWPEKWLIDNSEALNLDENDDFGETAWASILTENALIELEGLAGVMHGALDIASRSEGLAPYTYVFREDISGIEALIHACTGPWDDLCHVFQSHEFSRLPRCGKEVDKAAQEQVKDLRDRVKDRVKKMKEEMFQSSSYDIVEDLRTLYPLIQCLSKLVIEFGRRYAAKKREKSLLDFNDLEHFCLGILTGADSTEKYCEKAEPQEAGEKEPSIKPSRVALEYKEKFEEILIDEYQDSNLVQEVILNMISRKECGVHNIFMVGDVKQSIYRFRQAKPELFMDKYRSYADPVQSIGSRIQLFKNFRSREGVLNGVNLIFKQIMSCHVGELDYTDEEALNPGMVYADPGTAGVRFGGPIELHLINTRQEDESCSPEAEDSDEETDDEAEGNRFIEDEKPDAIQMEARVAAQRIRELMAPDADGHVYQVYDKKINGYRELMYKDIVILLRTTRNWADIFVQELGAMGIPAYADTGTGYFKTTEVQTMISLLQIIDNPMQDIPLLAVLRSPIASFTPDELIDIRLADRRTAIYEAMKKLSQEGDTALSRKAEQFLKRLEHWRDKAAYLSTDELIWFLYTDTGYYSYTGAMPGGEQRQANLRILFERARQYEATSYKGLFNFVNFINKLKSSSGDMGSAKILGENENVVRIMSIHKSKGLEFPVVFVSGCGKKFNMQDLNRSILLHQDLGFGPDYIDCRRRISYPTVPKLALKAKIRLETLSEEMRILYVALTRAREKLIITGTVKNIESTAGNWCRCLAVRSMKLPEYEMMKACNYLDWIGCAVIRHKDCRVLREMAGIQNDTGALLEDSSAWEIRVWGIQDVMGSGCEKEQISYDFFEGLRNWDGEEDQSLDKIVRKRLEWVYPYRASSALPVKISVTELKKRFNSDFSEELLSETAYTQPLIKRPAFMEESQGLNAAEKGTLLHFIMQHLDIKNSCSLTGLRQQIDKMLTEGILTAQQVETVDIEKVYGFFQSSLGQRMVKAEKVYREVPFNIEISCTELYKNLPKDLYNDECILLQGVIDCYFEEDGELVLFDYKTDYIPSGGTEVVKEKYRVQIDYYCTALEKITGRNIKEKYLYLFWNGGILSM